MFNRRSVLIAAAILPIAACSGTGGMTPADIQAFIAKVRAGVSAACGFLPDVEDVLALLGVLPVIGTVESVVNMICSALSTPPLTYAKPRIGSTGQVIVKGVVINGTFTR